ncbi:MAG TPA: hypothetical protein VM900_12025 [Sphingomonas sp.]|nr:hypothetical protein [Sphingomonas sp.]
MFRSSSRILAAALGAIVMLFPVNAGAQSAPEPQSAPFAAVALDDSALGGIAGREDTRQISTSSQVAGVSQNSVGDNVQTGDARISDNAFQNLSGLSILNVNTGNNVAINATMNVNIAIQQAP